MVLKRRCGEARHTWVCTCPASQSAKLKGHDAWRAGTFSVHIQLLSSTLSFVFFFLLTAFPLPPASSLQERHHPGYCWQSWQSRLLVEMCPQRKTHPCKMQHPLAPAGSQSPARRPCPPDLRFGCLSSKHRTSSIGCTPLACIWYWNHDSNKGMEEETQL